MTHTHAAGGRRKSSLQSRALFSIGRPVKQWVESSNTPWGATKLARTLSPPLINEITRGFARSRRIPTVSVGGDRWSSEHYSAKWQEFSVPRFWAPRNLTAVPPEPFSGVTESDGQRIAFA